MKHEHLKDAAEHFMVKHGYSQSMITKINVGVKGFTAEVNKQGLLMELSFTLDELKQAIMDYFERMKMGEPDKLVVAVRDWDYALVCNCYFNERKLVDMEDENDDNDDEIGRKLKFRDEDDAVDED